MHIIIHLAIQSQVQICKIFVYLHITYTRQRNRYTVELKFALSSLKHSAFPKGWRKYKDFRRSFWIRHIAFAVKSWKGVTVGWGTSLGQGQCGCHSAYSTSYGEDISMLRKLWGEQKPSPMSADFTEHLCTLQLLKTEPVQAPRPPPRQSPPSPSSFNLLHVLILNICPCGFLSLLQIPAQRANCGFMSPHAPHTELSYWWASPFPLISHSSAQGGPKSPCLSGGSHLNSLPQSPTPSEGSLSSLYLSGK